MNTHRIAQDIDALDEPFDDAPRRDQRRPSIRDTITRLSHAGNFGIKDVQDATSCTYAAAMSMVSTMVEEGSIVRTERGRYTATRPRAGFSPHVSLAGGIKSEHERLVREADAFFADRAQFPGAKSPLPLNRPPTFREFGGRR